MTAWLESVGRRTLQDDSSLYLNRSQVNPRLIFFPCSLHKIEPLTLAYSDRYVPIPSIPQRANFFHSIQLPLLHAYKDRIKASLDAFETLSSALVRAVPGALGVSLTREGNAGMSVNIETQRLTSGVEGAQRLCKALVSIDGISRAMTGWEDEVVRFF